MNTIFIRGVLVLFVLAQLSFFLLPRFGPGNYRKKQFAEAAIAWKERPSVETERAWHEELSLLRRHKARTELLILGSFLAVNGLLFYRFWNYGKSPDAA